MDLEFKRKIEERMKEIPAPLSEAIRNSGWEGIVFDIGRKYSLHVDDIGNIQNELILVLTGITHPDDFRNILIREIGIQASKTDLIIEEINNKVNEKIKNFLKNHLDEESKQNDIQAEKEEDGSNIKTSEKRVLRGAGISLGDDAEDPETPEIVDEEEVEVKISPLDDVSKEQKTIVNSAPSIPDIRSKLENPQVFKGKSTAYLDPYREPIE